MGSRAMRIDDEFLDSLPQRPPGPGSIFQYTVFQCTTDGCAARKASEKRNRTEYYCKQHTREPMERIARIYQDRFEITFRYN